MCPGPLMGASLMLDRKDLFLSSLERCASSDGFIAAFYERFLATSDEVRELFQHTDFDRQRQLLLKSLRLIAAATAGSVEGLQELHERAESHDHHHLNIKPELYEFWRESLVETAEKFDEKWNGEIHDAWEAVLGHAISYMTRRY